jgi:hypothetical protein
MDAIFSIIVSASLWFACYRLIKANAPPAFPTTHPFMKRYISVVHAFILSTIGLMQLRGAISDETWVSLLYVPAGYLVYDLYFVAYEPTTREFLLVAHHAVFLFFLAVVAPVYPGIAAMSFLSETTQPALHLCWGMLKTGAKQAHPFVFLAASVYLGITFFFGRIINFLFLAGAIWEICPTLGAACPLVTAGTVFFVVLNMYWFGILLG